MKLLTKAIETKLDKAGRDGNKAICKFFNPVGSATWVVFGRDQTNKDLLFCAADLGFGFVEAGDVSLNELETISLPMGMKIERDRSFIEGKPLKDYLAMDNLSGC